MRWVLLVLVVASCDKVFGLDAVAVPDGDGPVSPTIEPGCSDQTREAFSGAHTIAGCAGAWSNPGLTQDAAALCEVGWHICTDANDALQSGVSNGCEQVPPGMFFATRQGSSGVDKCDGLGTDDIFGCGNGIGMAPNADCGKLNAAIGTYTDVLTLGDWAVGGDAMNELSNVTKGPNNGGVLCCVGPVMN